MPPALSAIVPNHDTRELALACVGSLARWGEAVEIVLVDDGSGDGSADAIARAFPRAAVVRRPTAGGFARAIADGVERATADLLWLVNSDCVVLDEGPARLIDAFAARPRLGIAGAALFYPDGRPQWSGGTIPGALWLFALASGVPARRAARRASDTARPTVSGHRPGRIEWVPGAAMAVRRPVWEEVGPFSERFHTYAQDLDLCVRARERGWQVDVVRELRVVHRLGATIAADGEGGGGQRLDRLLPDLALWADGAGLATGRTALLAGALIRWLALAASHSAAASAERAQTLAAIGALTALR